MKKYLLLLSSIWLLVFTASSQANCGPGQYAVRSVDGRNYECIDTTVFTPPLVLNENDVTIDTSGGPGSIATTFDLSQAGGASIYSENGTAFTDVVVEIDNTITFKGGQTNFLGLGNDAADTVFTVKNLSNFNMMAIVGTGIWRQTFASSAVATLTNNLTFLGGDIGIGGTPDLAFSLVDMAVNDGFHLTATGTGEIFMRSAGANDVSLWLTGEERMKFDTRNSQGSFMVGQLRLGATGNPSYLIDIIADVDDGLHVKSSGTGAILARSAGANDVSLWLTGEENFRIDTRSSQQNHSIGSFAFGANSLASVAQVEITSTTKGFRITPMTATQASAITPVEALMVFVSDTNGTFTSIGFWGYENGAWAKL